MMRIESGVRSGARDRPVRLSILPLIAGAAIAALTMGQAEDQPPTGDPEAEIAAPSTWDEIWSAVSGGKVHVNDRLRLELVDQDGKEDATALTNRLRLGYGSQRWRGYSLMVEIENVVTPDRDGYFVPGIQGDPNKAVIADPSDTEMNQAYVDYLSDEFDIHVRAGRQRIIHDNARFIGNVGWRQFEQTFDAANVDSSLGEDKLEVSYTYVWGVQRIFGPDGKNFDSDSHFVRIGYQIRENLDATGFVYLLDFDNSPADSTQTYGVRVNGSHGLDTKAGVELEFTGVLALQSDYGTNATNYEAAYVDVNLAVAKKDLGKIGVEYELLGSDDGVAAFRTPLATLHGFNGWADVFLATPAAGLQDLSVYVMADLPCNVKGKAVYHQFWTEEDSDELGSEFDVILSKKINANWSVDAKLAVFEGDNGFVDRTKFWLQTTFTF